MELYTVHFLCSTQTNQNIEIFIIFDDPGGMTHNQYLS